MKQRALIIGAGLIGGSVAASLDSLGWAVTVADPDPGALDSARRRLPNVDIAAWDPEQPPIADAAWDAVVIASPAGAVTSIVAALEGVEASMITDVASVKGEIAAAVTDRRFVPGHPMAGSEVHGIAGADPGLFRGASWVLTPTDITQPEALAQAHALARSLGAEPVVVGAEEHDQMVAMVSHVPHLTAVTLMGVTSERAGSHSLLLRLAANGFRDMTRIAAGHPSIWPDICIANREAIQVGLGELIAELSTTRALVAAGDTDGLLERLRQASEARRNLPSRVGSTPERLAEVWARLDDTPGQLARITAQASHLGVNIYDIEMSHAIDGRWGVAIVVVERDRAQDLADALEEAGIQSQVEDLGPAR